MTSSAAPGPVLVTGATGYVGGRLAPLLLERGRDVRCLARRRRAAEARLPAAAEVVEGDLLEPSTLPPALEGADAAYYLVHSMGASGDFEEMDRRAAGNFARAARDAGLRRIVYLGGLGHDDDLSRHLGSRQEVGRILRASGVPTVELRASIVIGSGSLSFEMIRALVERLPVMITPRWVRTPAQPIAVEDVLAYLVEALEVELEGSRVFEIGGADVATYGEIMQEYARQRGLRRLMLPVPVLSPRLSSLWLGLVTPLYARIGRKLVTSLVHPTVVRDPAAREAFDVEPRGLAEAVRRAREGEDAQFAATRWSDALSSAGEPPGWGGARFGSRLVDARSVEVPCRPEDAFAPVLRIGGRTGWYFADALWRLRGFLDLLVGGVGTRRGRRHPEELVPGDTVDFWRVEAVDPPRLLRLRAEMRLPGRAWLQFEVEDLADGGHDGGAGRSGGPSGERGTAGAATGREGPPTGPGDGTAAPPVTSGGPGAATARGAGAPRSRIVQTALFDPLGLAGLAYWYALWPVHAFVFDGTLRGLARAAVEEAPRAGEAGPGEPAARAGRGDRRPGPPR